MDKFKGFLTENEGKELRSFLNRRDFSGRDHGRASAILHLDKGKSVSAFPTASAACAFFCIPWASFTRSPSMFRAKRIAKRKLFERIEQAHPSAESIYVIADNAGYSHAGAVKEYLSSGRSRIRLWFLPPYSPNLNLIERLWKFFRKKALNNRYYTSVT